MSALKETLFGTVAADPAPRKRKGKKKGPGKQPSFLSRLSDFQLLVFLSRQVSIKGNGKEETNGARPALPSPTPRVARCAGIAGKLWC